MQLNSSSTYKSQTSPVHGTVVQMQANFCKWIPCPVLLLGLRKA